MNRSSKSINFSPARCLFVLAMTCICRSYKKQVVGHGAKKEEDLALGDLARRELGMAVSAAERFRFYLLSLKLLAVWEQSNKGRELAFLSCRGVCPCRGRHRF